MAPVPRTCIPVFVLLACLILLAVAAPALALLPEPHPAPRTLSPRGPESGLLRREDASATACQLDPSGPDDVTSDPYKDLNKFGRDDLNPPAEVPRALESGRGALTDRLPEIARSSPSTESRPFVESA